MSESAKKNDIHRAGFVALVGRPNTGKSTLMNALAGGKVSIVSRRRQTTRGIIRAAVQHKRAQIILLDSPGRQTRNPDDFSRRINAGAGLGGGGGGRGGVCVQSDLAARGRGFSFAPALAASGGGGGQQN